MANTLYLVPSPIGNLNEISPRIKETLLSVDFIFSGLTLLGLSSTCKYVVSRE